MDNQIVINWNQAQEISQKYQVKKTKEQQEKIQEFKEMSHEMTDARDLIYFLEATGTEEKNIFDLLQHAKNLSPLIIEPLKAGANLDELTGIDPYIEPEEEENEPDKTLLNGEITIFYNWITFLDKFYIHIGDRYTIGQEYGGEENFYNSIEECKAVTDEEIINFAKDKNII